MRCNNEATSNKVELQQADVTENQLREREGGSAATEDQLWEIS